MSVTDELLRNAENYAAAFDSGDLPLPPAKKVAVVACMDARLLPAKVLGLEEGDAHVIRNAGGVVTDDEIRSLAISQRLLGTEEIILIHHTDCGMLTFTDDEFRQSVQDGDRHQAAMGRRGLRRPRGGRAPVDRAHPREPVHPAHRLRARLHLRGRDGPPARGRARGHGCALPARRAVRAHSRGLGPSGSPARHLRQPAQPRQPGHRRPARRTGRERRLNRRARRGQAGEGERRQAPGRRPGPARRPRDRRRRAATRRARGAGRRPRSRRARPPPRRPPGGPRRRRRQGRRRGPATQAGRRRWPRHHDPPAAGRPGAPRASRRRRAKPVRTDGPASEASRPRRATPARTDRPAATCR